MRAAIAGASGYAGGELLRLLLAHPEVEIGALTANSNAGTALGALQPHLPPLADRVLRRHHRRGPRRPRRRLPRPAARPVRRRRRAARRRTRSSSTGRRLPADGPRRLGAVLRRRRTPAPGPTACPSCPGQRAALGGTKRIAVPGCYPTAVTLALFPALRRRPGRARRGRGRRLRHLRRGQGAQAAPARQRGHGLGQRVRRRRRPPAHPGDEPEPPRGGGRAGHRLLHPDARPDAARHPRHLHAPRPGPASPPQALRAAYEKALRRRAVRARCCPRASGPPPRAARLQHRRSSRSPSTSAPAASSRSAPSTT